MMGEEIPHGPDKPEEELIRGGKRRKEGSSLMTKG